MMHVTGLIFVVCCAYSVNAWLFEDSFFKECRKNGAGRIANLIQYARAERDMEDLGPVTFFAVRDDFFPSSLYQQLLSNSTLLREVLTYHIVNGTYRSESFTNDLVLKTFDGDSTVRTNIYTSQNATVPTITVNGARLLTKNIQVTHKDGVIHITDKLLYPIPNKSILTAIATQANFTTLLYAIAKANIRPMLEDGPFTFFAPTNSAFQKLPPGLYNEILNDQTALIDVLTYHLVEGSIYKAGLYNGGKVNALNKKDLTFTIVHGKMIIDDNANITAADLPVTNGVIHVIDAVLIPL